MSFEAYSVAVKIQLINQAAAGLVTLSGQFRGAERDAAALQGRLKEIHRLGGLALASGAVGAAGFAGLGIFHQILKPAERFTHELAQMNQVGLKQKEIAESVAAAWEVSHQVMTSTASDNLKAIREMRQVFGNTDDAIRYLPQMQMLQAVLDSTLHGQGGIGVKDVAYTAARALELRGVSMNPKDFLEQADLIARAAIASGGKITPHDQLLAQKYSGQYGASFSNRFRWGIMPTLVQELGGASTGTALTSLMQALTGGRMTPQAARLLSHLTLHGKPLLDMGRYQAFRSGMPGVTAAGALQGTEHGIADPDLWIQNYLMAALREAGITDPAKQAAVLGQAFSNRTAARAAYLLGTQGTRLDKDAGLINQAHGIAGYYDLIKSDPDMASKALSAAWENLKTAFGLNVVPILIPAMNKLAQGLNDFGEWARKHPNLTKDLVVGFGALSAAMAIGGTLGAVGFAFKGITSAIGLNGGAGALGSLGLLTTAIRALGGVAGAGAIGYGIGTIISNNLSDKTNDKIGKWLAFIGAITGHDDAREAFIRNEGWDPRNPFGHVDLTKYGTHAPVVQVHSTIKLNERTIAEAVSQHQGKAFVRSNRSTGSALDLTGLSLPAVQTQSIR